MEEQTKKLRIAWSSNAPFATSGYSIQTEQIIFRMQKAGYPTAMINFYGTEGGSFHLNGVKMYPKIGSTWGEDALLFHGQDFKADVSFTSQDIWTLDMNILKQVNRWIAHVPIDHEPPPPAVVERLRLAYRIVTVSKFGKRELEKQGLYSTYIPYTVDTEVLKPLDREKCRTELGIPQNLFIFGMVAANKDNPSRKSFQEAIDAFALFHANHPESGMYFHTLIDQHGGFPIKSYWQALGLPPEKMFHLQPYDQMFHVGRVELTKIINSFDCLLAPSSNEGFGVPIIEAQSCGIPVVVNDFTAMPELVIPGETGFICKVAYKRFSPLGSFIAQPDVNSLHNCMVDIFKKDRKRMGEKARKFVVENYDSETVFNEQWKPYLARLENEVYPDSLT